ncbi:MAG: TIGR01777 family oxidoreductase [Melioribacteraceae bacterium]|nr:TIGR01777 family oxidoreductase [Melioribacteraceae bacterium]
MKKIIITGISGLIGKNISNKLLNMGYSVVGVTRNPERTMKQIFGLTKCIKWNEDELTDEINGSFAVIHLAGENVMASRWDEDHKSKILNSRVDTTKKLVAVINSVQQKPEVYIGASAIGYYGVQANECDEYSNKGNDFLSDVVSKWENASEQLEKVRRVIIRIGIVLDRNEGALSSMIVPFKFFVGGPIGSGHQPFPWIHIDDITNLFIYGLENDLSGVYNGVSPESVTLKQFSDELGKAMHRPSFMKVPEFIIKILYGEGADNILKGVKINPKKTLKSGFKFKFASLPNALKMILNQ